MASLWGERCGVTGREACPRVRRARDRLPDRVGAPPCACREPRFQDVQSGYSPDSFVPCFGGEDAMVGSAGISLCSTGQPVSRSPMISPGKCAAPMIHRCVPSGLPPASGSSFAIDCFSPPPRQDPYPRAAHCSFHRCLLILFASQAWLALRRCRCLGFSWSWVFLVAFPCRPWERSRLSPQRPLPWRPPCLSDVPPPSLRSLAVACSARQRRRRALAAPWSSWYPPSWYP